MRSAPILRDKYALACVISLPDLHASSSGPWPVLCFLHGDGEAVDYMGAGKRYKDCFAALRAHGPLKFEGSLQTSDFIIVAPQLPGLGGDVWEDYAANLEKILLALQVEFDADLRRTYLSGFSYGANGVFDIGDRQQGRWAALWPVDATRIFRQDSRRPPVWLWYGTDTQVMNDENAMGLLEVGSKDKCPTGDKLVSRTGKGHVPTAISAYKDSRVYRWLSQR
jgi:predicted peptidase